jgi:hypothetical protein
MTHEKSSMAAALRRMYALILLFRFHRVIQSSFSEIAVASRRQEQCGHTRLLVFPPQRFFVFTLITFEFGLVPLPL